eukprot:CAMPEP_0168327198 /NCGR_PEP_ID=MMETSP0213-20121227/5762_1 /TAXON_ID=151035 /ORGANISM="Euplotes harpa, Strain FSP1.4" /LENGTH=279 /DNA_ID=CAMNT_0008330071 /DNA_START=154 /DNA_END=993 /DNA_ORIENTATION=-
MFEEHSRSKLLHQLHNYEILPNKKLSDKMKYYYFAYNVGYNYSRYMHFEEKFRSMQEPPDQRKALSVSPEKKPPRQPWSPLYDLALKTDFTVFNDILLSMRYIKNLRNCKGEKNKKLLAMKVKRQQVPIRKPSKMNRLVTKNFKLSSKKSEISRGDSRKIFESSGNKEPHGVDDLLENPQSVHRSEEDLIPKLNVINEVEEKITVISSHVKDDNTVKSEVKLRNSEAPPRFINKTCSLESVSEQSQSSKNSMSKILSINLAPFEKLGRKSRMEFSDIGK